MKYKGGWTFGPVMTGAGRSGDFDVRFDGVFCGVDG